MNTIADPRVFPAPAADASSRSARCHAFAETALSGDTGQDRAAADDALRRELVGALRARDTGAIAAAIDASPSAVIHRHLLRALRSAWADRLVDGDAGLVAHGFAIPVVVVAAADAAVELPALIPDSGSLGAILGEHGCLGSNRTFGLANVLAGVGAVGIQALDSWLAWRRAGETSVREIEPVPIAIVAGRQGAHLRFVVGSAIAAPGADLLRTESVAAWGIPFARELSRQLSAPGVQLLALPRGPADPLGAWQQGLVAHREIGLQLFASDAIRALRAAYGDPTAVISAHRAEGNGELRLSLSSPFAQRMAEGFRYPLFPFDRIDDALASIVGLLRECRIDDIRIIAGVHGDQDAATGLPLFFRADALPGGQSLPFH